jgi:tripartite ATP-independent transporter DctP family solute receptor
MRKGASLAALCSALALVSGSASGTAAQPTVATLRYAHMNTPESVPGMQAAFFAERVGLYTGGSVKVEVYPDSQLGTLKEMADEVSSGVVAFHHNTAGTIGELFEDYSVLDTPYIYRDVAHLLKVADPGSPIMARLSAGLLMKSGVRLLYTFYFGARELTCDRPIRKPEDLKSLKVRSIPFPIYMTAIEGLGAIPTPIDWVLTPTALKAKVVNGQDNPLDIILDSKLYETQPYLMLTNHILAADSVVVNDAAWRRLSSAQRDGISRAAAEAGAYATRLALEREAADLAALRAKGMTVIGPAEGLDVDAFRANTRRLVEERFGAKWDKYYRLIDATR